MKIAIVAPYAEPEKGAAVIRINAFRDYFKEKGCEVSIFAPERKRVKKAKGVYRYKGIFELMKHIFFSDFDIVLGTSPPLTHNFFALVACRLSRKKFVLDAKEDPLVFEPLPNLLSIKGIKRRIYFLLRELTYKHADLLFFLTEWDKKEAIQRYKLDPQKCVLVSNGSDTSIIYYSASARKNTRRELNIPNNATMLVYAGSIGDEEIDKLIETFDKLNKENIFLLLVVTIEKTREWELEEILKKAKAREKIRVVKNVPYKEMYKYFSASDIGIVPWPEKYYTSLPVKVFDYLASGLPIIIKGPKKGALRDFYEKNPFIGAYVYSWPAFYKALTKTLETFNEIKTSNKKRRGLIEKEYNRRTFLIKAFKRLKELLIV